MDQLLERFLPFFLTGDACWNWVAKRDKDGYGIFPSGRRGKRIRAHRFSFKLFKKEEPGLKFVCHTCDNPSCVNPAHLFLGSTQDNTRDRDSKNRQAKGEKSSCSKLNTLDVFKIREVFLMGIPAQRIAFQYRVTTKTITTILKGESWKHLRLPPLTLKMGRPRREIATFPA